MKPTRIAFATVVILCAFAALLTRPRAARAPRAARGEEPQKPGTADAPDPVATAAMRTLLASQVEAWNRGDIAGFMEGYWQSERATFAGSQGVSRGWQALLDRYRRSYPNRAAMGRLEFSEVEVTLLGADAALVLGHWQLEREKDRPGGVFTLVARRFPEGWRIIHDHTSVVEPPAVPKQ